MAIPLQIPVASTPVEEANGTFKTAWRLFLLAIANKLINAAGVAAVSSADLAAPAAAIVTADIVALASPITTSPDATAAGAAYSQVVAQSVVTLANELKADLNSVVVTQNLDAALTNETKAKINTILTYLSTVQALTNEEKARFNALRTALNQ
jgi:hypothetical protein